MGEYGAITFRKAPFISTCNWHNYKTWQPYIYYVRKSTLQRVIKPRMEMEMERNEIGTELAWQLSSEHYDFVLYEDWWFWRFRARPYLVKECDKQCVAFCRCMYIATKLRFADFDSCTVVRYVATTADVRPNPTTVCLLYHP